MRNSTLTPERQWAIPVSCPPQYPTRWAVLCTLQAATHHAKLNGQTSEVAFVSKEWEEAEQMFEHKLAAQDRQDPGLINNFRTAVTARCAGEKSWSMLYYALALDIGCCRMLIAACIRPWCFLPQHETLSKKPRENWVRDFSCQWFLFPTSSPSPAAGSAVLTVALQQTSCLKPWRLTNKSWSWWPPSSTMSTMLQTRQWKEMPCLALLLPVGLRQAIGRLNPGSKTKQLLYLLCL